VSSVDPDEAQRQQPAEPRIESFISLELGGSMSAPLVARFLLSLWNLANGPE
jgi:hypothetical protein